jgi:membrane protease YdiL (CAAX protease family)
VLIVILAMLAGVVATGIAAAVLVPAGGDAEAVLLGRQALIATIVLAAFQVVVILLTLLAAGFFASNRAETLALRTPRGGWGVLVPALAAMFVVTGVWTGALLWWSPETVIGDVRIFKELLQGETAIPALILIGLGAPLSEELLFRGFLFSGLAKSRLGLVGTSLLTAVLWTALHAGYSIFGLIEVLAIGLYFSWLLVRTGSVWVTIICHAVYNTVIGVALYFITLPPPA